MKEIAYSKSAIKTLRRLPSQESVRIRSKISQYASDPQSLANNVKKLTGEDGFRLRVGDWRVLFDESETVIAIIRIGPRGDIYKGPER